MRRTIPPERNDQVTSPGCCFALITDPVFEGQPAASSFGGGSALVFNDVVLIIAAGLTLGLLLMLWVRYGRGNRSGLSTSNLENGGRRRRRRREPLRRNPTRAETGGLPPIRADGSTQPLP